MLTVYDRRVLRYLRTLQDPPTVATVAAATYLSQWQAYDCIRRLAQCGYVDTYEGHVTTVSTEVLAIFAEAQEKGRTYKRYRWPFWRPERKGAEPYRVGEALRAPVKAVCEVCGDLHDNPRAKTCSYACHIRRVGRR